jgi:predicted NAD/FAD-binding protein
MTTIKLRSSFRERGVWDVIVIGAGVSGLHSAYLLQKAGLSALVLEARDRVGGKILTTDRVKGTSIRQEYGAAWINDSTQDHIWKVAAELGLTPMIQVSEGRVVAQDLDGRCLEFAYGEAPMVSIFTLRFTIKKPLFGDSIPLKSTQNDASLSAIISKTLPPGQMVHYRALSDARS